ncbi:Protein CBG24003 [Caenorhabditis briggsae]|uniref:Protein CBG24002 n=1 Tax=Caenorhabditis briggsae TaxID=6238 RepID=G2J668_CAEBR|nr:Protein CBG24002 [Caenorhabditis briggsae]XP_002648031.1 Protein CBG24003 [Caenorhabditis briggsae]CAP20713.1 Protein CBG24002 [Caenorhabditis briggsae]CAP20714.1 Protein CBG24003 [Caenorhabditis briggsae]
MNKPEKKQRHVFAKEISEQKEEKGLRKLRGFILELLSCTNCMQTYIITKKKLFSSSSAHFLVISSSLFSSFRLVVLYDSSLPSQKEAKF